MACRSDLRADPFRSSAGPHEIAACAAEFTAHACNYLGGAATIDRDAIRVSAISATAMACGGEPNTLDRQVDATANGSVSWSVSATTLTLTNRDGHALTYRVRPATYPDMNARTIVAGDRAGGQSRLSVDGPTKGNDHLYIVFEKRSAPGNP